MSYIEVLTSNGLSVTQWDNQIQREYLDFLFWKLFISTGRDSILQAKDNLMKESGDTITYGLSGQLVGGRVDGASKGEGNEGTMSFFNQSIVVDQYRRLVRMDNVSMSNQRVKFNVLVEAKQALTDAVAFDFDDDVTDALSATSAGRVQGRYLYGAADSNWNATHATALANVDETSDKLTTKMISVAKRKATSPKNAVAKIRPVRIKSGMALEEWYTLFGHPFSIRDLMDNDAAWQNRLLNLTPQANMSNSPFFTGSRFKGNHDGVLIYEYPRLLLEVGAGASSIDVSHNLLCGAQAGAVAYAQRSKFAEETDDVGHDRIYEISEIRGIQKFVFNRATPEDHGVVHVFASAVADA